MVLTFSLPKNNNSNNSSLPLPQKLIQCFPNGGNLGTAGGGEGNVVLMKLRELTMLIKLIVIKFKMCPCTIGKIKNDKKT